MAVPLSWDAPLPESPPPSLTIPPEVSSQLKAVRVEDIDIFGWKAQEATLKERHDADFEMFRRINDEATRARAHTEHEQARRHRPSPSLTPPPPPPSQPAPQPQHQEQPPSHSVSPPSTSNKRKRLAEDAEEKHQIVRADDHLTETCLTVTRKRQRRGLEMTNGGICKVETSKRKLKDVDEEKDNNAEEAGWTASKDYKSRVIDLNK